MDVLPPILPPIARELESDRLLLESAKRAQAISAARKPLSPATSVGRIATRRRTTAARRSNLDDAALSKPAPLWRGGVASDLFPRTSHFHAATASATASASTISSATE